MTITFRQLDRGDIGSVTNLIADVFPKFEPLASSLTISTDEFRPYVAELAGHALPQGLSWGAEDSSTGEIIGTRLCTDLANDFDPTHSFGPKIDCLARFLDFVTEQAIRGVDVNCSKAVHAHMVAVLPKYQGLRIASALLARASQWAFQKGFVYSYGEVTSPTNLRVLARIPSFEILHSAEFAGQPFSSSTSEVLTSTGVKCVAFRFLLKDFSDGGILG